MPAKPRGYMNAYMHGLEMGRLGEDIDSKALGYKSKKTIDQYIQGWNDGHKHWIKTHA